MKEAVLKAIEPGKRATIDDPEHGKTIDLDLTKPENAASLRPNDKGQLEYDPTPDMTTPGAQPGSGGPTPGAQVTIKADEDSGEDSQIRDLFADWLNSEDAPFDSDAGDYNEVFRKAVSYLRGRVDQGDVEEVADLLTNKYHGDWDVEETVGGDPTDDFVDDVVDHDFARGLNESIDRIKLLSGLK